MQSVKRYYKGFWMDEHCILHSEVGWFIENSQPDFGSFDSVRYADSFKEAVKLQQD